MHFDRLGSCLRSLLGIALIGATTGSVSAQAPAPAPSFEVATIKVHPLHVRGKIGFYGYPGGRVEVGIATVKSLLADALDVREYQMEGLPGWTDSTYYDIVAIPPENSPSRTAKLPGFVATPSAEQRAMLLSLLMERFGLQYHIEAREGSIYLLTRGKGPLHMTEAATAEREGDPRGGLIIRQDMVSGEAFGTNMTMKDLARQLS